MMKGKIQFTDLGSIEYNQAWQFQESKFNEIVRAKSTGARTAQQHLLFCEHPHVYTLGKSGAESNLLINHIQLQAKHAQFVKTNRGGDITYHGPGQIVGYPILDLEVIGIGLKKYIYLLEEVIISALADFNISSQRLEGATGVWVDAQHPAKARKICAIGVRTSKWVTMHGFALNVNTDLSYFDFINPCGFTDKKATSMEKEIDKNPGIDKVKANVKSHFEKIFQVQLIQERNIT
jgi:lipoyl(octanoyl) transferase